jgi:hypothetical protein
MACYAYYCSVEHGKNGGVSLIVRLSEETTAIVLSDIALG